MNKLMNAHKQCKKLPFGMGKWVFSTAVSWKAPYFKTIKPMFQSFEAGRCVVTMKNRKSVQNHLGSVHAAAMCNLAELTAGSMLEGSLSTDFRWLPKNMDVQYKAMAKSDLKAICEVDMATLNQAQDLPMVVNVLDKDSKLVFRAVVAMHITEKKKV